jgi:Carboxypeptidase regulatory-like domain/TonB-dependent Receptor Plug Domain
MPTKLAFSVTAILFWGIISIPLWAQTSVGIKGRVTNSSGAVIPNVKVSVRSARTGETRTVITTQKGFYTALELSPGVYEITASLPGFSSVTTTANVELGVIRTVNLVLQPGNVPTGANSGMRTSSSSTGGSVNSKTVRDLPSNGRDWMQAATLEAGVEAVRTQPNASDTNSGRGQRGFGAQISVSGGRPQQNNYVVDGISINDYANAAPGSVLGVDLGSEAVEEVSVVTSNYPASYGRSSGGIINAATRSGSNGFHGSVYEFLRNSALDTRNYFDKLKPPFRRNQFGATGGGALRKDRTFIFGNYEGLRQSLGTTHVDTVLSPAARLGQLSTGTVSVDPAVIPYLAFYPLPNGPILSPGDTGVFTFAGQQVTTENYFTTRVDQKFTEHDSVTGTYAFDTAHTTQPDELNTKLTGVRTRRQVFTAHETHTFSSQVLNSFRVGLNRSVALIGLTPGAVNPLAADAAFGTVPGRNAPEIDVLGVTNFGGGLGSLSSFHFHWTSLQAYDDLHITRANHSLSLGFAVERMQDNMLGDSDPSGVFTFHSIQEFLTNRPYALAVALPGSVSPRNLRQTVVGGYAQDDFRWRRNLTINLGLRYEFASVPTEAHGKLAALRHLTDALPHLGDAYFSNPTGRDFQPRVGLAWDPFGNGKFAVRSGFGIFDVLPLPYEFELLSQFAAPFFELGSPTNLPPGSFPQQAFSFTSADPKTLRNVYIEPNPRRNYVMQWNLNLEFEPRKNLTGLIAYVGSRGIHQPFRVDDSNIVLPQKTPLGYLWPTPGTAQKINPNVGRMDILAWRGDSYYDALQFQLKNKLPYGMDAQVSYTFGKSIDTGSATIAGDQFENSVSSLPWFDMRLNRGLSDFNLAQNLSVHLSWEIPSPTLSSSAARWLTGGWQAIGNFQASTGSPFTVVLGGDPLGLSSTDPYDVPNRLTSGPCSSQVNPGNAVDYLKLQCFTFPNPSTLLGNLRRNALIGPGLVTFDVSLIKNNYIKSISDRFNAQFRVEAFNCLNRANFAPPLDHRSIFDQQGNLVPGAGLIDSTTTPSRQIQVGLKLVW